MIAELPHRRGCLDVVPGHVADDQRGGAAGLLVGVVPVAADGLVTSGGPVADGDLQVVGLDGGGVSRLRWRVTARSSCRP